jgi:hypothetical protein
MFSLARLLQSPPGSATSSAVASIAAALAPCTALAAQEAVDPATLPPPVERAVDYTTDVAPIFERACYSCHGPKRQRSDYRLDTKASALGGGSIGGAIVPGDSAHSMLVHYVAGADELIRMPEKGSMLTAEEVGILRAWIDAGAPWPDVAPAASDDAPHGPSEAEREEHWAYRPLQGPPPPVVEHLDRVRTEVDAFLLHGLEERGLHYSEPADRRTLLRRVTFDLTGLPPTSEETDSFLADEAPDAYERRVDAMLASPRYGERWARRWMDLVHFAETHGNDQDRPRPHAWPYRDWLIEAFNADMPYARFVEAQLAGDVLYPDDPRAIAALGFLAAGPWDESSQLNILDDTLDKQNARNLDRDDMLTTTMSTFVSTTVQCARCHDHKFDPIAQTQYYQLQSVFAGVDRADRPYDLDPELNRRRQAILKRKLALERARADAPELQGPAVEEEVALWERSLGGLGEKWSLAVPERVLSAGGATATQQPDGSILFGGERPDVDTTTLEVHTDMRAVTGLRLDVLTDETLPFHGPGRQDNGNLHLSEITVEVASDADPATRTPVRLAHASADFDQDGWTSAMAIDGDPATAWGIWPQVGHAHHAVFELAEPLDASSGARLTIVLAQLHGQAHLIGRLRIALTSAPPPVRATTLPEPIRQILARVPEERTPEARSDLARFVLLQGIEAELQALPPPELVYAGTTDFTPESNFVPARGPRPVHLLVRGDVSRPGEEVAPGALSCVPGLDGHLDVADLDDEGERRAALARWIVDARNTLTWRSIVNRAWHYHFGRGIVATPSDFGVMGSAPSHPELLDWLASWFLGHGGSLKQLDRLLVTSSAYMQATTYDASSAGIDADNALLWRMNRTRLDAESIRDAVLAVAGRLDLTMGGPSVKQFVESPGIHVTPNVDYESFDVDSPASCRRSIYRFLFRTLPDPFMETMDCPDASQLAPKRESSVTALQALALLHDRFIVRMSEHVAERVATARAGAADGVDELFLLVLGRRPSSAERAKFVAFVERNGMANAARLLFNSHEFVFVN